MPSPAAKQLAIEVLADLMARPKADRADALAAILDNVVEAERANFRLRVMGIIARIDAVTGEQKEVEIG